MKRYCRSCGLLFASVRESRQFVGCPRCGSKERTKTFTATREVRERAVLPEPERRVG